jgi:hypothetical protein
VSPWESVAEEAGDSVGSLKLWDVCNDIGRSARSASWRQIRPLVTAALQFPIELNVQVVEIDKLGLERPGLRYKSLMSSA